MLHFEYMLIKDFWTYYKQESEPKGFFQPSPNNVIVNGESQPLAATSMIRSHSVSGDLHGVQPDPVAADILRREPEHESFIKLKISPNGMASFV